MKQVSSIDWKAFLSRQGLVWDELPTAWDEGIFLGNGMMGALIFWDETESALRLELCRSDITGRRDPHIMPVSFARSRLKIGYFCLRTNRPVTGGTMHLDLYHARGEGRLFTETGELRFWCTVPRGEDVICFHWENSGDVKADLEFTPHPAVSPRQEWGISHKKPERIWKDYPPNPAPEQSEEESGARLCTQRLLNGDSYVTAWKTAKDECVISIANSFFGGDSRKQALRSLSRFERERDRLLQEHEAWWERFYQTSFVSLPDPQFENFYWIQLYKFASASREGGEVIDDQGPWLWDTAWPYSTWNLNVQLTYWLCCGSGHAELGMPLVRELCDHLEQLIQAVPEPYRQDSAAIGTAAAPGCISEVADPAACGGHSEVANLVWALHNCWLVYRHSMDETIPRQIYPVLLRAVTFLSHFMAPDASGVYHLAPTASPEYPNGVPEDCNYTLSLFRWGVGALREIERLLGEKSAQTEKLTRMEEHLCDYPGDTEQGFYIGKDLPYAQSHRHYSHLLMIYPLKLLDLSRPEERQMEERSLARWQSMPECLRGYSCTGAASISALLGKGNDALRYLTGLWTDFLRSNTLYKESGPVIETPFSAAQSILDMLLQSEPGVVRIFPAVPDLWRDCCFDRLMADGRVEVTAVRRDGKTVFVRLCSSLAQTVTLHADTLGEDAVISCEEGSAVSPLSGGGFSVSLAPDRAVVLRCADCPPVPVTPCSYPQGSEGNCYGIDPAARRILNFDRTDFEL